MKTFVKIKKVFTYSPIEKKVRLVRILWKPVKHGYYTHSLSINIRRRLFQFLKEYDGFFATFFGIQVHYKYDKMGSLVD